MSKDQIEEIKKLLDDLKLKCYLAKCPFAAVFQYQGGDKKEHRVQMILTPEAAGYKGDTDVFYQITNVMNGNFKTVLNREFPDDDGSDDSTFFG